ncbi:hypothetical protein CDL12_17086 [Handroanthus impetiginosus]|uniref:Uncharacterized protein n=1 Tax=Handroanthus impetiginosus TaxID=429701 RepID=A0A2G9GYI2_9LAMI|nr:hypothetical protein CDL12_17086 [Handroanthus impetiginosus]
MFKENWDASSSQSSNEEVEGSQSNMPSKLLVKSLTSSSSSESWTQSTKHRTVAERVQILEKEITSLRAENKRLNEKLDLISLEISQGIQQLFQSLQHFIPPALYPSHAPHPLVPHQSPYLPSSYGFMSGPYLSLPEVSHYVSSSSRSLNQNEQENNNNDEEDEI